MTSASRPFPPRATIRGDGHSRGDSQPRGSKACDETPDPTRSEREDRSRADSWSVLGWDPRQRLPPYDRCSSRPGAVGAPPRRPRLSLEKRCLLAGGLGSRCCRIGPAYPTAAGVCPQAIGAPASAGVEMERRSAGPGFVDKQHCKPALLLVVQRRPDHSEPADKGGLAEQAAVARLSGQHVRVDATRGNLRGDRVAQDGPARPAGLLLRLLAGGGSAGEFGRAR